MKFVSLLIALFGPLFAIVSFASASPSQAVHKFMMPVDQKQLTSKEVLRVTKLLPELIALKQKYHTKHGRLEKKTGKSPRFKAYEKALNGLAHRHQFKDLKAMQESVEMTMMAAGFINSGRSRKQVESAINAAQKRINHNPKLSEGQKSALLRRMFVQVSMVIPIEENITVVRKYFAQIKAVAKMK